MKTLYLVTQIPGPQRHRSDTMGRALATGSGRQPVAEADGTVVGRGVGADEVVVCNGLPWVGRPVGR